LLKKRNFSQTRETNGESTPRSVNRMIPGRTKDMKGNEHARGSLECNREKKNPRDNRQNEGLGWGGFGAAVKKRMLP